MAMLTGSSTAEIDAPLEQVWALVADVERAPGWQGGLKGMHALERGDERARDLVPDRIRRQGPDDQVHRPLHLQRSHHPGLAAGEGRAQVG